MLATSTVAAAVSVEQMKLARYQLGRSVFWNMRLKAPNVGFHELIHAPPPQDRREHWR